jgi:hypothetical protein
METRRAVRIWARTDNECNKAACRCAVCSLWRCCFIAHESRRSERQCHQRERLTRGEVPVEGLGAALRLPRRSQAKAHKEREPTTRTAKAAARRWNAAVATVMHNLRCPRSPGAQRAPLLLPAHACGAPAAPRFTTPCPELGFTNGWSESRRLTFELSGRQRHGAWPARRMMNQGASRAKCYAVGSPLERGVRRRSPAHEA